MKSSMSWDNYLNKSIASLESSKDSDIENALNQAISMLKDTFLNKNKLLVCGNGGSAADASHIAGELVGRFLLERKALPVISLSSDSSIITAWSNDYSYDEIFSRQVEAYGSSGDTLLAISTSGNSTNVLKAVTQAKSQDLNVISLTGLKGEKLAKISDVSIVAKSSSTPQIQQIHQVLYHYICLTIENELFL